MAKMLSSDSITISFIVPLHNRLDCTQVFLNSLLETVREADFEIIFVNDASSDGSAKFLDAQTDPRIKVLHNEAHSGYAVSVNRGARLAKGTFLGLLNNDLILTPGWLEPMLRCFEEKLRVGTVGNIQRNAEDRSIDHAGIVFDLVGLPDHYGKNYPFLLPFDYRDFPAVTAACMLIRRSLFEEMNGFDEKYLNGCEDVDLCLRLRTARYRNIVAGRSQVFHHVSASPGRRDNDKSNNQKLLAAWGSELQSFGQKDWPVQYLMRYWKKPWRYNGTKLFDAILRLLRLKTGDSGWAIKKRTTILDTAE
jgi:O-antigen biosynthesis protein